MDPEAHLEPSVEAAEAAEAFSRISDVHTARDTALQQVVRLLSSADPLERLIPEKLLYESVLHRLRQGAFPESPLVVFINRGGHGDGARVSAGLTALLAEHLKNPSLLHVSFNTPKGGLGALVRIAVSEAAAASNIGAIVSAHNLQVERLPLTRDDIDAVLGRASLVISYAASGNPCITTVSQPCMQDLLLEHSHTTVLSFLDPEGLVGELPRIEAQLSREPSLAGIRFWVQTVDNGRIETLGGATLGRTVQNDAPSKLWPLIENARRRPYRVSVEPIRATGEALGGAAVCPCLSLLKEHGFIPSVRVRKSVPAGSRFAIFAEGIGAKK
jgi:hypothetical protein